MVLGASPTAPKYHTVPEVDVVIAAGDGILLQRPDFIVITEERCLFNHLDKQKEYQAQGTKVILHDLLVRDRAGAPSGAMTRAYKEGHVEEGFKYPYDELVRCSGKPAPMFQFKKAWTLWKPGGCVICCSGMVALQYALNHGATELHMVGMEGYTGGVDYFSGRKSNRFAHLLTRDTYRNLYNRIIAALPDIQFIHYGKPLFGLKPMRNYEIRN